jgi:two-component system sensor histidine kinase KdpD
LCAQAHDTGIEIAVADRGPGLTPDEEKRVFDKFYRGRAEGSQSGVGLGLTICRAIVEAHGGRIWAERNPAGGAVFRFVLPCNGQPPEIERDMEAQRGATA